jgi:hypothetical protein
VIEWVELGCANAAATATKAAAPSAAEAATAASSPIAGRDRRTRWRGRLPRVRSSRRPRSGFSPPDRPLCFLGPLNPEEHFRDCPIDFRGFKRPLPDRFGDWCELVHTRSGLRAIFLAPEGLILGMGAIQVTSSRKGEKIPIRHRTDRLRYGFLDYGQR